MILEHNTYKEAVSDINLSDEAGMEMLENAIRKKERWSQKWRTQAIAAVAGIMVVALSANGICFAATGKSAWELFKATYRENSKEAAVIADNFQQMGDSVVSDNLSFTLEEYWYDTDNGMAYFTIRTDSLDGSPLSEDKELYVVEPSFNHTGSMNISQKTAVSEDKTSIWRYYHVMIAYNKDDNQDMRWAPSVRAGGSEDALLVNLEVADGGVNENGCATYKEAGSFLLEPTPSMKMKNLNLDCSPLAECKEIKLTGGGIKLYFENAYGEGHEKEHPFGMIELRMKDGTSRFAVEDLPEGDWEILSDDEREIIGYKSESMDITGDRYLGGFSSGAGMNYYGESLYCSEYNCMFNSFIDLDDVAGVYVDGVELPIK